MEENAERMLDGELFVQYSVVPEYMIDSHKRAFYVLRGEMPNFQLRC